MKYIIYRVNCDSDKYLSEKGWYGDLSEVWLFNEVDDAKKEITKISGNNIGYGVYSGKLGILEYEKVLVQEVMTS